MGRWGDGEMGGWGDGEMGRWGEFLTPHLTLNTQHSTLSTTLNTQHSTLLKLLPPAFYLLYRASWLLFSELRCCDSIFYRAEPKIHLSGRAW